MRHYCNRVYGYVYQLCVGCHCTSSKSHNRLGSLTNHFRVSQRGLKLRIIRQRLADLIDKHYFIHRFCQMWV